jgi:hypothetical protein
VMLCSLEFSFSYTLSSLLSVRRGLLCGSVGIYVAPLVRGGTNSNVQV